MYFYLWKNRIYEICTYEIMYHARVPSTKISAFHFFFTYWNCFLIESMRIMKKDLNINIKECIFFLV